MGVKKVLVLDVDETLLNIEPLFFLERFKKNYKEYEGSLIFNKYYISPRPNVREFLKKAKEQFDLVAYSTVEREYTKQKLAALQLLPFFTQIFGKEDLVNNKKSLKIIAEHMNTDINTIVLIDDKPDLVEEQNNVLAVPPWFIGSSKEDNVLIKLLSKLNPVEITSRA